ncbi:MAG: zinc ribbon domain-containing protein [Ramlibacter sp.]|nr:zinc ribbon domain-containing protein [Cryobacterium sp.]
MNCLICGAQLPVGAMFCGECGSSSTATPKTRKRPDPRPSDTTVIQPLPQRVVISVPIGADGRIAPPPTVVPVPVPVPAPVAAPVPAPVAASAPPSVQFPAPIPQAVPVPAPVPVPVPVPAEPILGFVPSTGRQPRPEAAPVPALFVLQFSTGETVSANGTGLVGRRPLPQPSEHFDILVQVNDLGRSVSKSHLEFGQHDGEFWVSDRFSGNGTIIRRPDAVSVRCEPGRRYLVPRGSRVDLADQFFILN